MVQGDGCGWYWRNQGNKICQRSRNLERKPNSTFFHLAETKWSCTPCETGDDKCNGGKQTNSASACGLDLHSAMPILQNQELVIMITSKNSRMTVIETPL